MYKIKQILSEKPNVDEAINKLHHYGFVKADDWKTIHNFKEAVESSLNDEEFYQEEIYPEMEDESKIQIIQDDFKELHKIWETIQYVPYFRARVSIHEMESRVRTLWYASQKGSNNEFFIFKELVEMINCFYDIKEPYKASNKIAYGWNFALTKDNFRPYLFGCIRNYLKRNDVEFETSDLQKICCLREIDPEEDV